MNDLWALEFTGRLVRSRSLDSPSAGRHTVDLGATPALTPGVYVMRLTQGARTMSARGAVVR